jgi:two-component system phosphate regulon sensor histidine kinase PhoR
VLERPLGASHALGTAAAGDGARAPEAGEAPAGSYRLLLEALPSAYVETDGAGVVVEANSAAIALLGLERRFLLGKPLAVLVPPDERPDFRARLGRRGQAPGEHVFQTTLEPRDRPAIRVSARVVVDQGEGPDGARWFLEELGDAGEAPSPELQRHVEDAVRGRTAEIAAALNEVLAQQRVLEAALREAPVALAVFEARSGRLLAVSDELARLIGTTSSSQRRALAPLVADSGAPVSRCARLGLRAEDARVVLPKPDGTRLTARVTVAPAQTPSGRLVVALVEDLERLWGREHRELAYVATAAHTLQNPLAVITSAVDVLQRGAKDDPDERDRFLGHIEEAASRLVRASRAILTLARVRSGQGVIRRRVVLLDDLLRRAAAGLRTPGSVLVHVECRPEHAVIADEDLLEAAIVTLAENAARHTNAGSVLLACRDGEPGWAAILVEDTGRGIPEEELERVVQPFVRGDGERGGSGLGLPIVREIAEALGGRLELESTVGVGTKASIVLRSVEAVAS